MSLLLVYSISICYAQIPRYLITTIPETLEDNDDPVTIIFDASQGNGGLANVVGSVYVHTGVTTEDGAWQKEITTAPEMTNLGDYKWKLTMPNGIRQFYDVVANRSISKIDILFKDANGSIWGNAPGETDIAMPVGNRLTVDPDQPSLIDLIR